MPPNSGSCGVCREPMNAAIKFSVKEQLVTKECGTCGIIYAVPEKWLERRREGLDGTREFYCPNGHCRYFTGETTESKLRRELEQAQKTASAAMQRAWVAEQAQRVAK